MWEPTVTLPCSDLLYPRYTHTNTNGNRNTKKCTHKYKYKYKHMEDPVWEPTVTLPHSDLLCHKNTHTNTNTNTHTRNALLCKYTYTYKYKCTYKHKYKYKYKPKEGPLWLHTVTLPCFAPLWPELLYFRPFCTPWYVTALDCTDCYFNSLCALTTHQFVLEGF